MQQQITQFTLDRAGITLTQRVVQLQRFLNQIGSQRFAGLSPIPGTAEAEISHHCHRAPQR